MSIEDDTMDEENDEDFNDLTCDTAISEQEQGNRDSGGNSSNVVVPESPNFEKKHNVQETNIDTAVKNKPVEQPAETNPFLNENMERARKITNETNPFEEAEARLTYPSFNDVQLKSTAPNINQTKEQKPSDITHSKDDKRIQQPDQKTTAPAWQVIKNPNQPMNNTNFNHRAPQPVAVGGQGRRGHHIKSNISQSPKTSQYQHHNNYYGVHQTQNNNNFRPQQPNVQYHAQRYQNQNETTPKPQQTQAPIPQYNY
eukprot:UN34777